MAIKWAHTSIVRDNGERIDDAIAPIIVSASRSTDIPAFYADWFMKRLKAGYVVWVNPFNGKEQYVSFEKMRFIVFWSKNPKPMLQYLDDLNGMGFSYYFQYTLNYYDDLGLEPNVPSVEERIQTFKQLSVKLGKERVIWRFDPLIIFDGMSVSELLSRVKHVGQSIHKFTEKLVFSFVDIETYRKVDHNLNATKLGFREFTSEEIDALAKGISDLTSEWGIKACTCGEPIDLDKYNIKHNKCVDDELIHRISKHDKDICDFLGYSCQDSFPGFDSGPSKNMKDAGQRAECKCVSSKDIGRYKTCPHLCVYCYANWSKKTVLRNYNAHNLMKESI